MARRKRLGYVVQRANGVGVLSRADGDRGPLIIWTSSHEATLFGSRREARNAIRRTRAYARRQGWLTPVWLIHMILPLYAAETD